MGICVSCSAVFELCFCFVCFRLGSISLCGWTSEMMLSPGSVCHTESKERCVSCRCVLVWFDLVVTGGSVILKQRQDSACFLSHRSYFQALSLCVFSKNWWRFFCVAPKENLLLWNKQLMAVYFPTWLFVLSLRVIALKLFTVVLKMYH